MRNAVRHAAWLALIAGGGFALFCFLLASGVGEPAILFYRGLALAAAAGVVTGLAGGALAHRRGLPPLALSAALACFSASACFLVLFPVTIDRSVSVYLLATLDHRAMTARELETAFVAGYVRGMRAIDRRIEEQRLSGNVSVGADGRVHLTAQGRRFVALSRAAAARLGTDPRFVHGYRSALRRHSTTEADPRR